MPIYRRRKGSDIWHWCTNCSNWPKSNFEKSTTKPNWELCNECKAKDRKKTCKKLEY